MNLQFQKYITVINILFININITNNLHVQNIIYKTKKLNK